MSEGSCLWPLGTPNLPSVAADTLGRELTDRGRAQYLIRSVDDEKRTMTYLLDYHKHSAPSVAPEYYKSQRVGITVQGERIRVTSDVEDPSSMAFGDGQTNDRDWAETSVSATTFTEVLLKVQLGETWRNRRDKNVVFTVDSDGISLGSGGLHSPGPATAHLAPGRRALLLLDVHEAAFGRVDQARTGLRLPAAQAERAFLTALREHPTYLPQLSAVGLERAVLGLVREAHLAELRVEPVSESRGLWIVRSREPRQGAMLVAVRPVSEGQVDLQLVDRLNGVRDRRSAAKAVVVAQSFFSADVTREYGGLSERMELVDYDRLMGMLMDAGWIAHEAGFLVCPQGDRPASSTFISYSHKTRNFAVWLYNRLRGWGHHCFLDQVDLKAGEVILSAVRKAVAAADAILLCCSADALQSRWVQEEIRCALEREKQEGRPLLIPLALDDALQDPAGFPELRERLHVDFRGWDPAQGWETHLRKVRQALAGS